MNLFYGWDQIFIKCRKRNDLQGVKRGKSYFNAKFLDKMWILSINNPEKYMFQTGMIPFDDLVYLAVFHNLRNIAFGQIVK